MNVKNITLIFHILKELIILIKTILDEWEKTQEDEEK